MNRRVLLVLLAFSLVIPLVISVTDSRVQFSALGRWWLISPEPARVEVMTMQTQAHAPVQIEHRWSWPPRFALTSQGSRWPVGSEAGVSLTNGSAWGWYGYVPTWPLGAAIAVLIGSWIWFLPGKTSSNSHCVCGYSLAALTSSTCSECGRTIRKHADA